MKNKVVYIVIAAVVVLALAIGFGIYFYNGSGSYVAKVDGEKITTAEYKFFLANVKASIEQAIGVSSSTDPTAAASFWKGNLGNVKAEDYAKEQALGKAQDFKIQLIKAKEAGIKLEQSDIDSVNTYINKIITNNNGKAAAEKAIKQNYGISLNDLKQIYKEGKIQDKFVKAQQEKIKANDQELKKYYDENMEKSGQKTTVWHILISTKDATTGQDLPKAQQDEKAKQADDVLGKVKAGVSFSSLVTQYSADEGSKSTGGQYTFGKGEMTKVFEDWAFKAKPGETGIVKSEFGYHVMKKPTFDEVKVSAKEGYISQQYENTLTKWRQDKKYSIVKNSTEYNKITINSI